jgi:uncharacterized protein (TIGR03435 family)
VQREHAGAKGPYFDKVITMNRHHDSKFLKFTAQGGFAIAAFAFANPMQAMAAQMVGQSANSRPAFVVASIKPDKSEGRPISDFPIGPGRVYVPREGIFRATHISLIQYIGFAYSMTESQMASLAGRVPNWVIWEGFDITASVEGKPSEDQLRSMMQSLLEDRFKLAIHKQDSEVPVLALVLAKPGITGPQLLPHSSDPPCPKTSPHAEEQETVSGGFPLACHGIVLLPPSVPGRYRLGARDVTLSLIADSFSGSAIANLVRPLIDRTGLTGTFDFVMEGAPETTGPAPPDQTSQLDSSGLTFREALQDQLGLKLEAQKGTIEMFVVDHVEHPTEN